MGHPVQSSRYFSNYISFFYTSRFYCSECLSNWKIVYLLEQLGNIWKDMIRRIEALFYTSK
jgi:hypothetical protein